MADDWGEFEGDPYENAATSALYSKGSDILYQARDGAWVPGKVRSSPTPLINFPIAGHQFRKEY
jgi:hypothetical protein